MSTPEFIDSPEAIAEDRRRIRRKVTWVLFFASPVLFVILFYAVENWRGARAWKKCREELEARGEKLDYGSFIPQKIPDEENFAAAPVIQARFVKRPDGTYGNGDSPNLFEEESKVDYPSGNWLKGESAPLVQWQAYYAGVEKYKSIAAGTNSAEAVLRVLSRYDGLFDELRRYGVRPKSRYPVIYDLEKPFSTLFLHFVFTKGSVQVLGLRSRCLLELGRIEEAGQDVDLMFRILESQADDPVLINWLVRLAEYDILLKALWEGSRRHLWTEAQLQRWQRTLSQIDQVSETLMAIRSERAWCVASISAIQREPAMYFGMIVGDYSISSRSGDASPKRLLGHLIPKGWFQMEQAGLVRIYQDEVIDPIQKRRAAGARIVGMLSGLERSLNSAVACSKPYEAILEHRYAATQLASGIGKVFAKAARAQTFSQLAATACALERHRLATGGYPDSLDDLLPTIQADLIQKGPLWEKFKYRRTPDGLFHLYSVGWDGVDDGGETLRKGDSINIETGDWVWPVAKEPVPTPVSK